MCLMLAMAGPLHGPHPKSESNSSWQYLRKQTNQSQLKMETLRCVCNVYQYLENFFSSLILFIRFICFANSFDERKINSNKNICTKNNNMIRMLISTDCNTVNMVSIVSEFVWKMVLMIGTYQCSDIKWRQTLAKYSESNEKLQRNEAKKTQTHITRILVQLLLYMHKN